MSGGINARSQDLILVLSGLQRVARAVGQNKEAELRHFWKYSSIKQLELPQTTVNTLNGLSGKVIAQKGYMVLDNTTTFSQALATLTLKEFVNDFNFENEKAGGQKSEKYKFVELNETGTSGLPKSLENSEEIELVKVVGLNPDLSSLDIIEKVSDLTDPTEIEKAAFLTTVSAKKKQKKVESRPEDKPSKIEAVKTLDTENQETKDRFKPVTGASPVATGPPKSRLSDAARETAVPATRIGRLVTFGSLGLGLGLGAVSEASKRALGISKSRQSDSLLDGSVILSEANAERIVHTLCKVRGAALKLGQMLSIQDESFISSEFSKIFERVRQSADFMPTRQMEKVMTTEFGPDWRKKHFKSFSDQPFAAASIGQVHMGETYSGQTVAVKIQYPGVAQGIESDINNLLGVLKVAKILPERLFVDKVIEHMKIELAQECDYVREAECCRKMRRLVEPYPEFYVPKVIDELSTKQVFTTELINGLTIDQCAELEDQETRDYITLIILELLLRELFIFRYMQTDPNWANFLYNPDTKQLGLLDFGATREYRPFFVNNYFKIIDAAANGDRDQILKYSRIVGFLTGYESKIMNDAHVDSVMILGEAFRTNDKFNFGEQRTTARMQEKVSLMLQHRLCAPPPEVYSLHRKMSGLFLLSSKLRSNVNCYHVWRKLASEFVEHPEQNQVD